MTPDDHAPDPHASDPHAPAPHASETRASETRRPMAGGRPPGVPVGSAPHGPPVLMILAVSLAVIGLVALAAILVSALLGWTVWPGFVLASYFCLPVAFLLMAALVVRAALRRRRS